MGKSKKEKQQAYFFDNKALLALILPLVVEQLLAVLVGMAVYYYMCNRYYGTCIFRKIIYPAYGIRQD